MSRQSYLGGPPPVSNVAKKVRTHWRLLCTENFLRTIDVKYSAPRLHAKRVSEEENRIASEETSLDLDKLEETSSQKVPHENDVETQPTPIADIELSGEQKAVMKIVLEDKQNVFFTGAAGTGKSVLLRSLIRELNMQYRKGSVAVTALTGIAACNIGGQTLHRFAGIGLGDAPVDVLLKHLTKQSKQGWLETQVLLIDEISMMKAELLEKLNEIAQILRKNDKPFGGIQLVFTGDLFQLPPIVNREQRQEKVFCFETPIWNNLIHRTINLTQVFRQKDNMFANILNQLRVGEVSRETEALFNSLSRPPKLPKGIVPTKLFATRKQVDNANAVALQRLDGTTYEYLASDWISPEAAERKTNMSVECPAAESVELKVGCQVMLTKNIDHVLVNGSIGKIVAFVTPYSSMRVKDESVKDELQDFDGEVTEEVLELMGNINKKYPTDRKRQLAQDLTEKQAKNATVLPVVKFTLHDNTIRQMIVQPEVWTIKNAYGEDIASRCQIPLMLSWALSIHKSQGQTLPYVSVDLNNIFASGQAYVAISRATCLEGLQIHRFNASKVRVNMIVKRFYESLDSITQDEIMEGEKYYEQLRRLEAEAAARNDHTQTTQNTDPLTEGSEWCETTQCTFSSDVNDTTDNGKPSNKKAKDTLSSNVPLSSISEATINSSDILKLSTQTVDMKKENKVHIKSKSNVSGSSGMKQTKAANKHKQRKVKSHDNKDLPLESCEPHLQHVNNSQYVEKASSYAEKNPSFKKPNTNEPENNGVSSDNLSNETNYESINLDHHEDHKTVGVVNEIDDSCSESEYVVKRRKIITSQSSTIDLTHSDIPAEGLYRLFSSPSTAENVGYNALDIGNQIDPSSDVENLNLDDMDNREGPLFILSSPQRSQAQSF